MSISNWLITLFEKVIDHNLIYDHDLFGCQEVINSGMLLINLAILKLFVDDRNSFTIEERKNLDLNRVISLNLDENRNDESQSYHNIMKRLIPIL